MPKFKCSNENCDLYQTEILFTKITSKYDKSKDKMIVKEAVCKKCGNELDHILENDSPSSIQLLRTSMMSMEDKKNMLRKRSRDLSIPENKRLAERKKAIDNNQLSV